MEGRDNKDDSQTKQTKGLRIRVLNTCMIVLSCIIFLFLIYNTAVMPSQYQQFITGTDEYIACEEDAAELSQASDYLTEQVRLYVQNMDPIYMERYFEEVNVTKRRENALEELKRHNTSDSVQSSLESALQCSNDLMNREIYAMKLISTVNGYDEDMLPEEVKGMALKAADAALSPEEMIEEARTMVFDSGYQDAKALIRSHLDHFTDEVLMSMSDRQKQSETDLDTAISRQRFLVCVLFVLNVITFAVISILIVRPLTVHVKRIHDNELLEIIGSYEFKYLALTYNNIYELNAANQAMLTKKAEHDQLTGIMNRGAMEKIRLALKDSSLPVALALFDVDCFKKVNDSSGHAVGDSTLKNVASLLTQTFRSTDYVIRMGGDEFAVIMPEMRKDNYVVFEKKIQIINQQLKNPQNGLPPVSLSAGIAFSEKGFRDDLYNQADEALYFAKEHGRCGCHAYE